MTDVRHGQALLLRPAGPLDADSCGDLRHQLASAFAAGVTSVAVDLSAVTSVDTTGLGVLVGAARHLRKKGGTLVIVHPSPEVLSKLRFNGLSDLLDIPASPPLRLLAGSGGGSGGGSTPTAAARSLSVVPGLKRPS